MPYGSDVRWEELFADLEAQAQAEERAELEAEVVDRTRHEQARLRVVDRLRGAEASGVVPTVSAQGMDPVAGRVAGVGPDWVLLMTASEQVLVALSAVDVVTGLGPESAEPDTEGPVVARLGLGHALRAVARDRAEVRVTTVAGSRLTGTVDRVGRDYFELAEHPVGEPRARGARRLVPFAALASVRTSV